VRARPFACVIGGVELVRALGAAGIHSLVVGPDCQRLRRSRFAVRAPVPESGPLADVLLEVAAGLDEPPVIFTDHDEALLELSRERERLAPAVRFLLPPADLVDDLTDKGRFQDLARRLDLPVPPGRRIDPAQEDPADVELGFPLVLKPVPFRNHAWRETFGGAAKALRVDDRAQLEERWPQLLATGLQFLAQELVAGDETHVVSYHVYIDRRGAVAGEFTGRKIRTFPAEFGMSSSLVTTTDEPLVRAGRDAVERLGLLGPAKLDFKRDAGGRLYLLEVNPRFTLWVQPGAVAGVNLAAIAYADLTGTPSPNGATARAGVRWISPRNDLAAARASGVPLYRWLPWAIRCETNQASAWNDPGPALWGRVAR
jgi:D-aspartate ligase